jgi:coenzyme F420-0:L-glutamate ligase/coenzyme F420-1:gamma-L-glutamate ligase
MAHPDNTPMTAQILALAGVPNVCAGDDLAEILMAACVSSGQVLRDGDVVILAQKIVSKAEGRTVNLKSVTPSSPARNLAHQTGKDPRLVELVLQESSEVVAWSEGVLIVAHRLGFVLANAGIDFSNVGVDVGIDGDESETVLLLPEDPDATARHLRNEIKAVSGVNIAVVINDSVGRAWRNGSVGMALGASGLPALADLKGRIDLDGRTLQATDVGIADEVAAAASLVMGQADEGRPIVLIRGLDLAGNDGAASDLVRPKDRDLFRPPRVVHIGENAEGKLAQT